VGARAIWKGVVRFGDVAVPVKLYSAVQDRGLHFHLLHARDLVPVKQRMVDPDTGKPVEPDAVRRALALARGLFVGLAPDELADVEPPPSRDVEVLRVLPNGAVRSQWYARPYWLGPDADEDAYFALTDVLERRGLEAIARWTMRKKGYVGALRAARGRLLLNTMRHAEEVIVASALEPPAGRALDEREVALAEQLVAALADHFDPTAFRDEHRERVLALLESKAKGEAVELPRPKAKKPAKSLVQALEASLRRAKEPQVA
jgi:DNA end-binding protein Ku